MAFVRNLYINGGKYNEYRKTTIYKLFLATTLSFCVASPAYAFGVPKVSLSLRSIINSVVGYFISSNNTTDKKITPVINQSNNQDPHKEAKKLNLEQIFNSDTNKHAHVKIEKMPIKETTMAVRKTVEKYKVKIVKNNDEINRKPVITVKEKSLENVSAISIHVYDLSLAAVHQNGHTCGPHSVKNNKAVLMYLKDGNTVELEKALQNHPLRKQEGCDASELKEIAQEVEKIQDQLICIGNLNENFDHAIDKKLDQEHKETKTIDYFYGHEPELLKKLIDAIKNKKSISVAFSLGTMKHYRAVDKKCANNTCNHCPQRNKAIVDEYGNLKNVSTAKKLIRTARYIKIYAADVKKIALIMVTGLD